MSNLHEWLMDFVDVRYERWTIDLHILMVNVLECPMEEIEIWFLDRSMKDFEEN